jgi:thiamine transport system ATP-binding protein
MLEVREVRLSFGRTAALDGIDLDVKPAESVAILGPSGSGKSSLLRVVAGLVPPDSGVVLIDGEDVADVPAHRRGVGLMFQDGLLFPHLTVAGNAEFGLRMSGVPAAERQARVDELLDLVGLPAAEFGGRAVTSLSGGEQQRVALARALAPSPRLLLLDEPFGALDAVLRGRLADDLRTVTRARDTTLVTVTHDRTEAFAFADRVAVMDRGRIIQIAPPEELWSAPASALVARLIGLSVVSAGALARPASAGEWLAIRPGGVEVVVLPRAAAGGDQALVRGVVESRAATGDSVRVVVLLDGTDAPDLRRVALDVDGPGAPARGERVGVRVAPDAVSVVPVSAD